MKKVLRQCAGSILVFVVGQLGLREALAVDAVPSIGDVGQHEGDDERHEAHGRERNSLEQLLAKVSELCRSANEG